MTTTIKIFNVDSIPNEIIDIIKKDYKESPKDIYGRVYKEQLNFYEEKNPEAYFVAAFYNDLYIGGVFLFIQVSEFFGPPPPVFEGMCKSRASLHLDIKLNSILIPAIKIFLLEGNINRVYVNPINNQRNILKKHYGFVPISEDEDGLVLYF